MDEYRKPTAHCKEFVGAEWLNPQKLITKKDLIYFVEHQIKWRKLPINNNFLMNDDYMQKLFNDHRSFIPVEEIPDLVERLLEPQAS